MARTAKEMGDIYTAIDLYQTFLNANPNNLKISFQLAECYRKARDYENAERLYRKCYDENASKYITSLFYSGQMLMQQGKYKEAKEAFEQFKKESKSVAVKNEKYFKKMTKVMLQACIVAPTIKDSALKVVVFHLDTSVNKAHIEASPISLSNTKILYSSLKTNKIDYFNLNDTSVKIPVRKFYVATGKDGHWKTTGEYQESFNDQKTNVANGSFSPDGNRFYFTKTTKNIAGKTISQIFVSTKTGRTWSDPVKLKAPINDPFYTTTQPTVGIESRKNFEVVYFVTDRPGGKGGTDIWYFLYDQNKDKYSKPRKIGSKLNTIGNEITPNFDMETHTLYFSSNGYPGLGGLDIFKSTGELNNWTPPTNEGYPINSEADDLYFAVSKNRESGFFTSNRKGGIALKNPTCCDDIYNFRWTQYIHIMVKGNIFTKYTHTNKDTINRILNPPQLISSQHDSLIADSSSQATIDSIQFSSSDSTATSFSVEGTQTDSTIFLDSAKVILYLINFKNGQETDFFIKSYSTKTDGYYDFHLEQGNYYRLVAEKDGYFNGIATLSTANIKKSDTLIQDIPLKRIPMQAIVLENIYYEFDKWDLTTQAKQTIDSTLYPILRDNPKLIVELSSHTDSKGNDSYNKKLSQKRAESVVNYLTQEKGIEPKRLVAKGYGESKPIAKNTNPNGSDNPEGRAKNRRTEFKVIGSSNQFSKVNYGPLYINGKKVEK
ncbi:MAG: OmpA family protein [Bacteroidales bacterium]|nr:OmpA family protein [Bacteroidales bacterium]